MRPLDVSKLPQCLLHHCITCQPSRTESDVPAALHRASVCWEGLIQNCCQVAFISGCITDRCQGLLSASETVMDTQGPGLVKCWLEFGGNDWQIRCSPCPTSLDNSSSTYHNTTQHTPFYPSVLSSKMVTVLRQKGLPEDVAAQVFYISVQIY